MVLDQSKFFLDQLTLIWIGPNFLDRWKLFWTGPKLHFMFWIAVEVQNCIPYFGSQWGFKIAFQWGSKFSHFWTRFWIFLVVRKLLFWTRFLERMIHRLLILFLSAHVHFFTKNHFKMAGKHTIWNKEVMIFFKHRQFIFIFQISKKSHWIIEGWYQYESIHQILFMWQNNNLSHRTHCFCKKYKKKKTCHLG